MEENKDAPPPYPGLDPQSYPPPGQQYATPGQPYPPPGQPYPPPPQGQQYGQQYGPPVGQAGYPAGAVVVQPAQASTVIVRAGNCPNCRAGVLMDQFTCCGILCGIFFFPLGLICCLLMRRQVCSNCGAGF